MITELRRLRSARPFSPFTLRLEGSVAHRVARPELIMVFPSGNRVLVADENDDYAIFPSSHIVDLEVEPAGEVEVLDL
jgi:hypothetical protein